MMSLIPSGGWKTTPWWTTLSLTGKMVVLQKARARTACGLKAEATLDHGWTSHAPLLLMPYAPNPS